MAAPRKINVKEAVRLRKMGIPVRDIALRYDVSAQAVRYATSRFMDADSPRPPGPNDDIYVPETFSEMLKLAQKDMWVYYTKIAKGVAKVQAFNAIKEMAKREQESGEVVKEPEPLLADVISGVAALSDERKREILVPEHARLLAEVEAVERVLAELGEVVAA